MLLKDFYSQFHSANPISFNSEPFLFYKLTTSSSKNIDILVPGARIYSTSIKTSSIYDPFNLLFIGEVLNTSGTVEIFLLIFFLKGFQLWFFKIKLSIIIYIHNKTEMLQI